MPGFQGVISNHFRAVAAAIIPVKIQSAGPVPGARQCHEYKISATLPLWKSNGPRKPEILYTMFDCNDLKQARTRPGSEHYRCHPTQAGHQQMSSLCHKPDQSVPGFACNPSLHVHHPTTSLTSLLP